MLAPLAIGAEPKPDAKAAVLAAEQKWVDAVIHGYGAALEGVSIPAFSSALSYFDAYRTEKLPANLIQAQRDYFGAHTFERVDQPRGKFFHVDWPDPKRPQSPV